MNEPTPKPSEEPGREEQKLRELHPGDANARDLASRIASTSEDTARLFSSDRKPD
jgi:hypothetical protein